MNTRTLGVAVQVSTDKALMLEGGQALEQEPPAQTPAVEDWAAYVQGLRGGTDTSGKDSAGS
jgi:hypothetical protein